MMRPAIPTVGPSLCSTFDGHTAPPLQVMFTRDGKKLVSSSKDKTVQIWDVESGERLRVIHPPVGPGDEGTPRNLVVDPQGKNLAFWVTVKDEFGKPTDSTFVCALETGRGRRLIATGGPMAFSPDGKVLAIAQGVDVRLVDIATGKQVAEPLRARPQPGGGWSLSFAPDGNTLAVMVGDGKIHLLDGHTLKPGKILVAPGPLQRNGVARWADNQTLLDVHVLGPKHQPLHVWDAEQGELKKGYSAADLKIPTPKGEVAVKIGYYLVPGTTEVFIVTHQPDAAGWAHQGRLFDWATGTVSAVHTINTALHECNAADIAPGAKLAAQGDSDGNSIILWDPRDGHEVRRLKASERGADGRAVFWRSDTAVGWDMPRGLSRARGKKAEAKEAKAALRSRHELNLITLVPQPLAGEPHKKDSNYQGLHAKAGKLAVRALGAGSLPPPNPKEKKGLKIAPKNIGLGDMGIEITGATKQPIVFKTNRPLRSVTFVAGPLVALCVTDSPWLQIVDPKTGKQVHRLDVVRSKIESLAVSPNQKHLLVGSADQTLTIYNPATNHVLMTIFPSGGDWVAWTPEGYYAGTPAGTRLLGRRINNGHDQLATFYPADRFRTKFYRPNVIERVLLTGSVAKALELANDAKGAITETVAVAELLPPRATLTAVDVGKSTYRMKASAIAGKGQQPVMALRLLMDGRPMPGSDTLKEFPGGKAQAEAEWTVELPEGKHQFAVLRAGPTRPRCPPSSSWSTSTPPSSRRCTSSRSASTITRIRPSSWRSPPPTPGPLPTFSRTWASRIAPAATRSSSTPRPARRCSTPWTSSRARSSRTTWRCSSSRATASRTRAAFTC